MKVTCNEAAAIQYAAAMLIIKRSDGSPVYKGRQNDASGKVFRREHGHDS